MLLRIRRAVPRDAARLSAIALASKRDWGYPARWLELWAPRLSVTAEYVRRHPVYAAVGGRRLCGFYALVERPRSWALDHFWVHPDSMGQGVGRRLFTHARHYLGRRGVRVLRIVADPNAAGFYEKMGARPDGSVAAPIGRVKRLLPKLVLHL